MAGDKLGEIAVNVKSEGAEDALQDVADTQAEADEDGLSGGSGKGGQGGGVGGLLGGISTKLAAILGFVAFLASLKPIQELLSGIQRLFSVAILPLVSLLTTFLRPILQKLLRFIGNLDFDNLLQDLTSKLGTIASTAAQDAIEQLPGVGNDQAANIVDDIGTALFGDADTRSIFAGTGGTISREQLAKDTFTRDLFFEDGRPGAVAVNVTGFREQSNTTLDQNAAETANERTFNTGPGG
jgi:hypothetical protein